MNKDIECRLIQLRLGLTVEFSEIDVKVSEVVVTQTEGEYKGDKDKYLEIFTNPNKHYKLGWPEEIGRVRVPDKDLEPTHYVFKCKNANPTPIQPYVLSLLALDNNVPMRTLKTVLLQEAICSTLKELGKLRATLEAISTEPITLYRIQVSGLDIVVKQLSAYQALDQTSGNIPAYYETKMCHLGNKLCTENQLDKLRNGIIYTKDESRLQEHRRSVIMYFLNEVAKGADIKIGIIE